MLLSDCRKEMALWCQNNKSVLNAEFDPPLTAAEYSHCLDPDSWEVMIFDLYCPNGACNTGKNCLSDTCPDCVAGKEVIQSGYYHDCIVRHFEHDGLEGQLRGSIITDPTDTKVIRVEAHGE